MENSSEAGTEWSQLLNSVKTGELALKNANVSGTSTEVSIPWERTKFRNISKKTSSKTNGSLRLRLAALQDRLQQEKRRNHRLCMLEKDLREEMRHALECLDISGADLVQELCACSRRCGQLEERLDKEECRGERLRVERNNLANEMKTYRDENTQLHHRLASERWKGKQGRTGKAGTSNASASNHSIGKVYGPANPFKIKALPKLDDDDAVLLWGNADDLNEDTSPRNLLKWLPSKKTRVRPTVRPPLPPNKPSTSSNNNNKNNNNRYNNKQSNQFPASTSGELAQFRNNAAPSTSSAETSPDNNRYKMALPRKKMRRSNEEDADDDLSPDSSSGSEENLFLIPEEAAEETPSKLTVADTSDNNADTSVVPPDDENAAKLKRRLSPETITHQMDR